MSIISFSDYNMGDLVWEIGTVLYFTVLVLLRRLDKIIL